MRTPAPHFGTNGAGHHAPRAKPSRASIVVAFALLYVIWGSTYLGIRVAIETIPPLLMAGIRFLIAGAILYAWERCRGARRPSANEWRTAAIVGACLIFAGNGGVTYSEQFISSGLAAVLVAAVPMFIALVSWAAGVSGRPRVPVWIGIAIATAGVAIIVRPGIVSSASHHDGLGVAIVLTGSLIWSAGSVYAGRVRQEGSPFIMAAMQMMCGSILLILAGSLRGEWQLMRAADITPASAGAMIYLIVAGSIVAFTAYLWLLRNVEPTRVATYAYVNPVVAIFLGHVVAREEITLPLLIGSGFVIIGVALIVTFRTVKRTTESVVAPTAPKALCGSLAPPSGYATTRR